MAVLIDTRGLFLTSTGVASMPSLTGTLHDGTTVTLRVRSVDEVSQLAVLEVAGWEQVMERVRGLQPATLAQTLTGTEKIFAVTPQGTNLGDLAATQRPGILRNSQRFVPLSEIRFESNLIQFTGGVVFTSDGRLVGIINATLAPLPSANTTRGNSLLKEYGPKPLVIGYCLDQRVLSRVVTGFRSPDQTPKHPTFGLFYRNSNRGVVVDRVDAQSPAARAGLRANDLLLTIDDAPIRDSFWLAAQLFGSDIGVVRQFKVVRGSSTMLIAVTPIAMTRPQEGRQPHLGKAQVLHDPLGAADSAK